MYRLKDEIINFSYKTRSEILALILLKNYKDIIVISPTLTNWLKKRGLWLEVSTLRSIMRNLHKEGFFSKVATDAYVLSEYYYEKINDYEGADTENN